MNTSPTISFGKNALDINDDAVISVLNGGLQTFANLNDLKIGLYTLKPYATYEQDFWLLDGEYKFMPATGVHVGWMSLDMSPASSNFGMPKPELLIDFNVVHSTNGLYLTFSQYSGDYADSIRITFYDASLVTIREDFYAPTGPTFFTNQPVSNFKRILIQIISTNRPYRYARLTNIDFDTLTRFTGTDIKSAQVIEEINPLSIELPVNTLELSLFSSTGEFSIVNPTGMYANLQYKEPLDVHEQIGNAIIYIGRFYLDKWESISENEAKFEASDAIGLLDKPVFLGGLYQSPPIASEDLINDIMTTAGVNYFLDPSLNGKTIPGLIDPYTPCRSALQQVCFYIGAYVTCARSNVIQILPLKLAKDIIAYDYTLTSAEKGLNSPLTLRPLVTGVEVHEFDFFSDNAPTGEILYNDNLGVGTHTIILGTNSKMPSGLILGGTATYTMTLFRYTHCIVNVTAAGTVTLTQNEGETIRDLVNGIYNESLPAGTPKNILTISVGLIAKSALSGQIPTSTVTQRVYDYFQQRYLQKTKLFASFVAPGNSILINVQGGRQLKGILERMSTDLAGGFVSDIEIVGVIVPL